MHKVCSMTLFKVKVKVTTHKPFKVGNLSILKSYLCHLQWELATDHWFVNQGTISEPA